MMTDLTLSQFGSLSKQELRQVLKQEEAEMLGSHPKSAAGHPTGRSSTRLLRLISGNLRILSRLKRRTLSKLRVTSRT